MLDFLTVPGLLAAGWLEGTWHTAMVILGVGFLIFVHELGHFAVAKWANVKVEAFSLGFGPFWEVFKKGETSYRISAIPLGGYVKMVGELPGEHDDDPRSVSAQSVGVRAAIFSAGVVMNAITAILIFICAFGFGVDLIVPEVPAVTPGSEAWKAGVRAGDRIVSINGMEPIDFEEVFLELMVGGDDGAHTIVFERDGEQFTRTLQSTIDEATEMPSVGIVIRRPLTSSATVDPDGPAAAAGMKSGDRIVAVDGVRRRGGHEIIDLLMIDANVKSILVERDGTEQGPFEVKPTTKDSEQKLLGVRPFTGVVGIVRSGSIAANAGLQAGDELLADGQPVGLTAFATRTRSAARGKYSFDVWRHGASVTLTVELADAIAVETFLDSIGPELKADATRIEYVPDWMIPDHPLRNAGVPNGAALVSIGGTAVSKWPEFLSAVKEAGDGPMDIEWRLRDGPIGTVVGVERTTMREIDHGLGFAEAKREVRLPVGQAISVGFDKSMRVAKNILQTLGALFTNKGVSKSLGGPVLIFQASKAKAEEGFMDLLFFLGMLSVNLAILNILPLPILDGGHLMFLLIEKVRGRPVSQRTLEIASWIGLFAILALLGFATFNDISRIFGT